MRDAVEDELSSPKRVADLLMVLTVREVEVAKLAGQLFSDVNIGAHLGIAPDTVGTHLRHVYRKLRISTRLELASYLGYISRSGGDPEELGGRDEARPSLGSPPLVRSPANRQLRDDGDAGSDSAGRSAPSRRHRQAPMR